MQCPKCNSDAYTKDGIVKAKQRYKCKKCNYRYTVEIKSTAKPKELKKLALILYLEGLGFRSIGRILEVSNVSVLNWIRGFGKSVLELKSDNEIEVVEMDEMHTYIGQKKTTAGYGLLLIEMEKGLSNVFSVQGIPKREKIFGKK
jgi:transposase-like protein